MAGFDSPQGAERRTATEALRLTLFLVFHQYKTHNLSLIILSSNNTQTPISQLHLILKRDATHHL